MFINKDGSESLLSSSFDDCSTCVGVCCVLLRLRVVVEAPRDTGVSVPSRSTTGLVCDFCLDRFGVADGVVCLMAEKLRLCTEGLFWYCLDAFTKSEKAIRLSPETGINREGLSSVRTFLFLFDRPF